jgi:putative polyketide hydroxylase
MQRAFARFGSCMGHRRRGVSLIDYGAVTMGYRYRSSAVLGASEDILPLLPKELAGEAGTRAPHVAVTFGCWEISTIDLYGRRFVLLACWGQWRGVDLGCGVRNAAAWRTARCIYRFGVELGSAEVAAAAHRLEMDGALLVRPDKNIIKTFSSKS